MHFIEYIPDISAASPNHQQSFMQSASCLWFLQYDGLAQQHGFKKGKKKEKIENKQNFLRLV